MMKRWLGAKRDWNIPTDFECYRSCMENALEATRRETEARRQLDGLRRQRPLNTEDGKRLNVQLGHWTRELAKAVSDQPHWRGMARFYKERLDADQQGDASNDSQH